MLNVYEVRVLKLSQILGNVYPAIKKLETQYSFFLLWYLLFCEEFTQFLFCFCYFSIHLDINLYN